MTIQANNYVRTAFSIDDATTIKQKIEQVMESNEEVTIDFTGISFFTNLFFSSAITCYVFVFGIEEFNKNVHVTGLTEIGQTAYEHSLEFACEESQLTPEQIKAKLSAVDNELNGE